MEVLQGSDKTSEIVLFDEAIDLFHSLGHSPVHALSPFKTMTPKTMSKYSLRPSSLPKMRPSRFLCARMAATGHPSYAASRREGSSTKDPGSEMIGASFEELLWMTFGQHSLHVFTLPSKSILIFSFLHSSHFLR